MTRWRIGYAPAGWTTLTEHLRRLGHDDAAIQEAGLARRPASRGTLVDRFRDRVMLAIRDERGEIVGFIGRARQDADARTPKSFNSAESATYRRERFCSGSTKPEASWRTAQRPAASRLSSTPSPSLRQPRPTDSPFSAPPSPPASKAFSALSICTKSAFSSHSTVNVPAAGGYQSPQDPAPPHPHSERRDPAPCSDPAEILKADGPVALAAPARRAPGQGRDRRTHRPMDGTPTPKASSTMRSAAAHIAGILPPETANAILSITGGQSLATLDDALRPIANPELPAIAGILPPTRCSNSNRRPNTTSCSRSPPQ